MKSRLDAITNWEELACASNYNVSALAKACGVSVRQLRRFTLRKTGKPPHEWLSGFRQMHALARLAGPNLIKEVAHELGFKQASHFSREFKHYFGLAPRDVRNAPPPPPMSDLDKQSPF